MEAITALTYAGTATPVLDYAGQPVSVTILAGQTTGTGSEPFRGALFALNNDSLHEAALALSFFMVSH